MPCAASSPSRQARVNEPCRSPRSVTLTVGRRNGARRLVSLRARTNPPDAVTPPTIRARGTPRSAGAEPAAHPSTRTTIAPAGLEAGEQAVALGVFILVASLGIGAPVAIYFALGEKSASLLGGLKDWMAHNNAAIMTVLLLVLGAKLLGDGITAL
jgi:hypothetical protein